MYFRVVILCALVATATTTLAKPISDARTALAQFSQCTVEQHPDEAATAVLSDRSEFLLKEHPHLMTAECLGPEWEGLQFPSSDFALFGLAEALVRREYSKGLPADIGQAAPLEHREAAAPVPPEKTLTPTEIADRERRRTGNRLLSIYGECVARADPVASLRLVLAKVDSSEEGQAFASLNSVLSSCLVHGQTLTFSKAALRGTIAMNLYRLAKAPRLPASKSVR